MVVWSWTLCGELSALHSKVLFGRTTVGFSYKCFWQIVKEGNGVHRIAFDKLRG